MPYIAPPLIAGLSHVTLLLYTILCSILSFWTRHRVRLASSGSPFEDAPSLSEKRLSVVEKRHKTLSFRASRFPLSRRCSSGSMSNMSELAGMSPPPISPISIGRSRRKPPPPLNLYGISTNYYSPSSPSVIDDDVSSIAGSIMDGMTSGESGYWLEDEDKNSPTGSLLDDKTDGWLPVASELSQSQAKAGRRILCVLAIFRAALGAPAVYEQYVIRNLDIYQIILTNLDLLLVDFAVASMVAIAPLLVCIVTLRASLPASWEHHMYHLNMILIIVPLLATLQLPLSEYLSIYRLACPVISSIAFLIARDAAQASYWAPLIAKRNSQAWL